MSELQHVLIIGGGISGLCLAQGLRQAGISATVYRGIGANIALRDAALLCGQLARAARGEAALLDAIHDYERRMIRYGFDAVRGSLEAMKASLNTGALGRAVSRATLRLVDRIPRLKRWFYLAMAAE